MKPSENPKLASIEEGCENLLNNLSDQNQVIPMIRSIILKNWERDFDKTLTKFLVSKEETIHEVCNTHYSDFGNTIHNILQMKERSRRLRDKIVILNEDIITSGKSLQTKVAQLQQIRTIQSNIVNSQSLLGVCKNVVKLATKSESQLKEKKYFLCLKTLQIIVDSLEKIQNCSFKSQFITYTNYTKSRIKEDLLANFTKWNETSMTSSLERGQFLFKKSQENLDYNIEKMKVDYSVVFEARQIYDAMDCEIDFILKYKDKRSKYHDCENLSGKALSSSSTKEFAELYKVVLFKLLDFFYMEISLVERHVIFYTESELHELWNNVWIQFDTILKDKIPKFQDPSIIFNLKAFLNDYRDVIKGAPYNFQPKNIDTSFKEYADLFNNLVVQESQDEINKLYPEKMFQTYNVQDEQQYNTVIVKYGLDDPDILINGKAEYPLTTRYAASVPLTCQLIEKMINKITKYIGSIDSDPNMVSNITNTIISILTNTNSTIHKFLKEYKDQSVSQYALLYINNTYLSQHCTRLEQLSRYKYDYTTPPNPINPSAKLDKFEKLRSQLLSSSETCRDKIYDIIERRYKEYLTDINKWSWAPNNITMEHHVEIQDIIEYLQTLPATLSGLSADDKKGVYFVSCVRLQEFIVNSITASSTKSINMCGIFNWNMDIIALENFAMTTGVNDLVDCFQNSRGVCDVLMSGDVERQVPLKRTQGGQLDVRLLKIVLDKFSEIKDTNKSFGPDNMISLPKLTKKERDNVLKYLNSIK